MLKFFNKQNVLAVAIFLLLQVSFGWTKGVGRIVDGEDASIENVPSMVQIYEDEDFTCGGSLISEYFVLTAAHCVENVYAPQLIVKAGASTLLEKGVLANVRKIILPSLWNTTTMHMDVAVLKLRTPLKGPLIKPAEICKTEGQQGDLVRVYGWGRIKGDKFLNPNQLQTASLRFIDRPTCKRLWSDRFNVTDSMICAAAQGKDTSNGDSGGPLYLKGKVCGLTSYGFPAPTVGYPTMYTDLASPKVKAFIRKALKQ